MATVGAASPLLDELHSLRSALFKLQSQTHQQSLQLHSASLSHTLTLDQLRSVEAANGQLAAELAVLRATPVRSDEAVELEEKLRALSLAHRKLSALADEADAAVARAIADHINEQAYRSRAEMKLALAVPPTPPPKDGPDLPPGAADGEKQVLIAHDAEHGPRDVEKAPSPSGSLADSSEVARLKLELEIEREVARKDRERLATLEVELDKRRRDDAAAAGVVERYMAFSQSSSLLLHGQLHSLRTRHAASLSTLSKENDQLRRELSKERREAERTRIRLGQVGEEAWIEAEGRRREIGLRLAAIGREERLMHNLRRWYDKVQAVLTTLAESDVADLAPAAASESIYATLMHVLGEASQILTLDVKADAVEGEEGTPSAQEGRVYMAEELLAGAMEDLRVETARRRKLEEQLAAVTASGVEDRSVLEDGEVEEPPVRTNGLEESDAVEQPTAVPTSKHAPSASKDFLEPPAPASPNEEEAKDPLLLSLLTLPSRHRQLQTRYSDLNVSLSTLLATPSPATDDLPPELSTLLLRALTRLNDILEDARVDLELSVADERRVVESYRVLLALGKEGQGTKASELIRREVGEFVEKREKGEGAGATLQKRADDIEWDFAALKAAWINPESLLSTPLHPMSPSTSPAASPLAIPVSSQHLFPTPTSSFLQPPGSSGSTTPARNALSNLGLRTLQPASLMPPTSSGAQLHPSPSGQANGFRRSSFANIGRMFRDQQQQQQQQGTAPLHSAPVPGRSFSFQSGGASAGTGSGWGLYRQSSVSGGSLGLLNATSPAAEQACDLSSEVVKLDEAASEDEVE